MGRKEDAASEGRKIGGSAVEGGTPLVEAIYDAGSGEVLDGGTGKPATPGFPYQNADSVPSEGARRIRSWPAGSRQKTTSISPRVT